MGLEPSQSERTGLARYADSERIKLRLDVNRYDLARQLNGIRRIV
jgi:hypothetical protein